WNLIDKRILIPAVIIILIISIPFTLYESESLVLLNQIFDAIVTNFGWGYIWYANILVVIGLYLSFSKYGKVVLGDPAETPDFTVYQYSSLRCAMVLGATVMRSGLSQWTEFANNLPLGIEAGAPESIL